MTLILFSVHPSGDNHSVSLYQKPTVNKSSQYGLFWRIKRSTCHSPASYLLQPPGETTQPETAAQPAGERPASPSSVVAVLGA